MESDKDQRIEELKTALRDLIESVTHPDGADWPELRVARVVIGDTRIFSATGPPNAMKRR